MTAIEVVDQVTLSQEFRIRQDVAQAIERTLKQSAQGERDAGVAASAADKERIRELITTDWQTRAEGSLEPDDEAIRVFPMFEYDMGPFGRAYAIEEGVEVEAPDPWHPEASAAAPTPGFDADMGPPVDDPRRLAEVSRAGLDDSVVGWRAEPGGPEPPDVEPTGVRRAPGSAVEADHAPEPSRAENTARAYQAAAGLAETNGGSGYELDGYA